MMFLRSTILPVLTRIGPGLSGSEMSGWRVVNCTLTWERGSLVLIASAINEEPPNTSFTVDRESQEDLRGPKKVAATELLR